MRKSSTQSLVSMDHSPRREMLLVDPTLVEKMAILLDNRKPDHVMDRLGISLNTWDKVVSGAPVRASVAKRIMSRFSGSNK